ncbi:hypothetical protein BD311DRAFT_801014, partial [Dichomitus squalens]
MILALTGFLFALFVAQTIGQILGLRRRNVNQKEKLFSELGVEGQSAKKIVGFFHPYCNAGGGGERVLWAAVSAIQRKEPDMISVVYSGDTDTTKEKIIEKVKCRLFATESGEAEVDGWIEVDGTAEAGMMCIHMSADRKRGLCAAFGGRVAKGLPERVAERERCQGEKHGLGCRDDGGGEQWLWGTEFCARVAEDGCEGAKAANQLWRTGDGCGGKRATTLQMHEEWHLVWLREANETSIVLRKLLCKSRFACTTLNLPNIVSVARRLPGAPLATRKPMSLKDGERQKQPVESGTGRTCELAQVMPAASKPLTFIPFVPCYSELQRKTPRPPRDIIRAELRNALDAKL